MDGVDDEAEKAFTDDEVVDVVVVDDVADGDLDGDAEDAEESDPN